MEEKLFKNRVITKKSFAKKHPNKALNN